MESAILPVGVSSLAAGALSAGAEASANLAAVIGSTCVLGAATADGANAVALVLYISALGTVAATIGCSLVMAKENIKTSSLVSTLRKGILASAGGAAPPALCMALAVDMNWFNSLAAGLGVLLAVTFVSFGAW